MDLNFVLKSFLEDHPILEKMDRNTLLKQTDDPRVEKSVSYSSSLLQVKTNNGKVYLTYSTTSQVSPTYMQLVCPLTLKKGMSQKEVEKALQGHLQVWCRCPDFNYSGFYYILNTKEATLSSKEVQALGLKNTAQIKKPEIRNPNLHGTICKHLYSVLSILPQHSSMIAKKIASKSKESSSKAKEIKDSEE